VPGLRTATNAALAPGRGRALQLLEADQPIVGSRPRSGGRVVDPGGHVGPFFGTDARLTLVHQVQSQPEPPGAQEDDRPAIMSSVPPRGRSQDRLRAPSEMTNTPSTKTTRPVPRRNRNERRDWRGSEPSWSSAFTESSSRTRSSSSAFRKTRTSPQHLSKVAVPTTTRSSRAAPNRRAA